MNIAQAFYFRHVLIKYPLFVNPGWRSYQWSPVKNLSSPPKTHIV